ncbi:MAG: UvrD-helicase domain-containing protein [Alistipes sp.]|nr:UvrD-helicase domain-containing protein [Alistipes sp.]
MRAKILSASAGSGKTYRLAYKYVCDVIGNPSSYRNILAVTFTNKATEEMKSRIIDEIHLLASGAASDYTVSLCRELGLDERTVRERAREARSNILHDYSRFTVLTIDTFFQRILRAFIRELGIDLDYSVELDAVPVLERSADALVKGLASDPELQQWLTEFNREQLDNDRTWDIRKGILRLGSELFKERNKEPIRNAVTKSELKKIVGELVGRAEASKKRVAELARRAAGLMREAGVEHGDFFRGFTKCFDDLADNPACALNKTVLERIGSSDGWFAKKGGSDAARALAEPLRQLLERIEDIRDENMKLWNTETLVRDNYRSFALLADLYEKAMALCEQDRMMLLSETKYILSQFITDNDAPFIYEKVGTRFDKYMIDEFQDTSRKEWENFLPLLRNAMSQSEDTSVFLVGDVKQSIYRWRGGDWNILRSAAPEALGRRDTEMESLRDNYRSLPEVVRFNNRIIENAVRCDNDLLNAELDAACASGRISKALAAELRDTLAEAYDGHSQTARKHAEYDGYVDISLFDKEPPIVRRIMDILDKGFRPKDIMILTRDRGDGVKVAEKLLEFKHSNSDPRYRFDVMTQEALIIGSSPVVRFVIAVLSLAVDADDRIEQAVYRRFFGTDDFATPLSEEETAFFRSIRMLSPEEAFERTVMRFGLDRRPEYTAYVQALHEQAVRFCTGRSADLKLFLEWWRETGCNKSLSVEQSETTIEITTVHKAKGLEKKVIIIPYCNWKLDPRSSNGFIDNYIWARPEGDAAAERLGRIPVTVKSNMADSFFASDYYRETVWSHVDNINLLYVALTRAVESLHIFIPEPSKNSSRPDTVGKLILSVLPSDGFSAAEDGTRHISFGKFAPPCADRSGKTDAEYAVIGEYHTHEADMRLRLPSQRYFEDGTSAELSPRNLGILMHLAFAGASSAEDIAAAVTKMMRDAVISPSEAERLTREINKALENPLVGGWFGGEWTEVRNENDIVVPHATSVKRPDRVMINGRRATVVDYKFGQEKRDEYAAQVGEYMELLRQIGYTDVEGYIWYVKLGEVERVGK